MKRMLALAAMVMFALSLTAYAADGPSKTGKISAVDAEAKTFTAEFVRPLTISVDDKTTYALDGNESTFADAVKVGNTATVTYTKVGEKRLASKVEVKSGEKKENK